MIKAKGNPDLGIDPRSGAVINVNTSEMKAAKARKEARIKEKNRIDQIEDDISEIKSLLKELIGKRQ
jgi:hypothetical protein